MRSVRTVCVCVCVCVRARAHARVCVVRERRPASLLLMIGQIRSMFVLLVKSNPRTSGDETMHQA